VPNGLAIVGAFAPAPQFGIGVAEAFGTQGTTNGGASVTPNGPLNPFPAPGENSVKNSPRS